LGFRTSKHKIHHPEENMPKRTTHRHQTSNSFSSFLRRPAVQIGLVLVVALVVVLIALAGGQQTSSMAAEINTAQAYQLYQQKGAFFVDVREQSEWDSFHIPETTLIPLGQLPQRLSEIPKDRPIVVVCRSGNRSASGRDILKQAGYTNVTSMAGGVTDWKTQGYPIQP
jgi:rhodanese-related sulfurtransferase